MKLWVDDIRPAPEGWVRAKTVTEAIRLIHTNPIEEVSLDHDISYKVSIGHGDARPFCAPETFEPVARFISVVRHYNDLKITLHTANAVAAKKMADILSGFDVMIKLSEPCNRWEDSE